MNEYAEQLYDAARVAVPRWVRRCVSSVATAAGTPLDTHAVRLTDDAARAADEAIGGRLRDLFETDVDAQRSNPLEILRSGVVYPTAVLRELGIGPVARHQFETERFPDDVYGLTPATWADIDESLYEPGIIWGAWKAKTVLDRRRAEGMR